MTMKTYSRDEVSAASLEYFGGDSVASDVFVNKYALKKGDDWYELTPADMHTRIAREFARIENNYPDPLTYDDILSRLSNWEIVPQGSPSAGIGNTFQIQSLSNCFVIASPHDSYGGILYTDEQLVQIMKRRGGAGVEISTIRPRGMSTTNSALTTDGITVFMKRFSNTTREVAQEGRRGALMLSLDCNHVQLEDFIDVKRDKTVVTGANISVKWTDAFMEAVESDSVYTLRWPVDVPAGLASVTKTVKAREVFDKFVAANWEADEPGAMFWDTIIRNSIGDLYGPKFKTVSSNPCAELSMPADDSCRLLVINCVKFIVDKWTSSAYFDFDAFKRSTSVAARLLDDLIDLEIEAVQRIIDKVKSDPEPDDVKVREIELWTRIKDMAHAGRRAGLGITGLGDAIAMLGLHYGDDESIKFTGDVYRALEVESWKESCRMARDRGSFPMYDKTIEDNNKRLESIMELDDDLRHLHGLHGRRNIAITTTAPVGSTSILTQTTSGIEPTVYTSYNRDVKVTGDNKLSSDRIDESGDRWHTYTITHPCYADWAKCTGHTLDQIDQSPYWRATVNDIDWLASVRLQAEAQKYVDASISKTLNFPASVKPEQIREAYITAWKLGCKGITIYREGTRKGIYTASGASESVSVEQPNVIVDSHAPKRPKELKCDIHKATIKGEAWTILVGLFDGRPYEVFGGLAKYVEVPKKYEQGLLVKNGKSAGISTYNLLIKFGEDEDDRLVFKDIVNVFENPVHGAWTRTLSLALRHGVPVQYLVEQLQKDKHSDMQSFSRVISRVLKKYIKDGTESNLELTHSRPDGGRCSEKLVYLGGCATCLVCGHAKC